MKKQLLFKLGLAGIIILGIWIPLELFAFFYSAARPKDNPWYLTVPEGTVIGDKLPYERPAHLSWSGFSRGDLAMRTNSFDPYARWVTFKTDYEGFRNHHDIEQADIVFIGDSFTEAGHMNEQDTFVWLAGEKLKQSVRNLGRAGLSPLAEFLVLKKYGLRNKPKTVVWQISESNDCKEALSDLKWWTESERNEKGQHLAIPAKPKLARKAVWRTASPTMRLVYFIKSLLNIKSRWTLRGTFDDERHKKHEMRFLFVPPYQEDEERALGWPLIEKTMLEAKALLDSNGIELVILFVPAKLTVYRDKIVWAEEAQKIIEKYPEESADKNLSAATLSICRKAEVPCIDATPALKKAAEAGKLVYLPNDTHLSKIGNQIVSDLIAITIASKK